jgi:hypothetical protein
MEPTFTYFSDRERGPAARTNEQINFTVCAGVMATLQSLTDNNYLAKSYPSPCPEKQVIAGTNTKTLTFAVKSEIPELGDWLIDMDQIAQRLSPENMPSTLVTLDLIEFFDSNVAKPIGLDFHKFYGHDHYLRFDREAGQAEFREKIELIFARNGVAYELTESGRIQRITASPFREIITSPLVKTGDSSFDEMLKLAQAKYLSPDPNVRRESLEKIWNAWERLKTMVYPDDKKKSIGLLLDKTTTEINFRMRLETEAKELTDIGNQFMIRHTEVGKTPISTDAQIDYFFQRLFALIYLLLKSNWA